VELFYYKGDVPNFGDDLNAWLWPRLIPEILAEVTPRAMLVGIGSILWDDLPVQNLKCVMGSGYGGYTPVPVIDESWRFYFVRGPRTAEKLGLPPQSAITDGAILLRGVSDLSKPASVSSGFSFMPHWQSALFGAWKEVCSRAGVQLIDPRGTTENILAQIQGSKCLITEAMHGAIVADALRIPWIPVQPTGLQHRFKWFDWCDSLNIAYNPHYLGASTVNEQMRLRGVSHLYPGRTIRALTGRTGGGFDRVFIAKAAKRLRALTAIQPTLSADAICEQRTEQALAQVERLRADFARGLFSNVPEPSLRT
jgi:succinoglycan biosynthesis protein ExoV